MTAVTSFPRPPSSFLAISRVLLFLGLLGFVPRTGLGTAQLLEVGPG